MKRHRFETLITRLAPLVDHAPPVYLVGGQVRDSLLDRPPGDMDLVSEQAEELAGRLAGVWSVPLVVFEKFGRQPCYRVVFGPAFEQILDFTSFQGPNLEADLSRRDFTLNAMAMEIGTNGPGRIVDPFKGREDLKRGLLRMTSDQVFASDPVRMLRGFRFCAQLGFHLETQTLASIGAQAELLQASAPERISSELLKLFAPSPVVPVLNQMDQTGGLEVLLPEIVPMKDCGQNDFHDMDVWEHSLEALKRLEDILDRVQELFPRNRERILSILESDQHRALLKMGTLLHDLGKPGTRDIHARTGRITFYGHDQYGAEQIKALARRLRLSVRDRELLQTLVAEHIHVYALSRPQVKHSTRMRFFRKHKDRALLCILLGLADMEARRGPASSPEERTRFRQWAEQAIAQCSDCVDSPRKTTPLISGSDLLAMGLQPGPRIGRILEKIQEDRDDGVLQTRDEALAAAETMIRDQG